MGIPQNNEGVLQRDDWGLLKWIAELELYGRE